MYLSLVVVLQTVLCLENHTAEFLKEVFLSHADTLSECSLGGFKRWMDKDVIVKLQ